MADDEHLASLAMFIKVSALVGDRGFKFEYGGLKVSVFPASKVNSPPDKGSWRRSGAAPATTKAPYKHPRAAKHVYCSWCVSTTPPPFYFVANKARGAEPAARRERLTGLQLLEMPCCHGRQRSHCKECGGSGHVTIPDATEAELESEHGEEEPVEGARCSCEAVGSGAASASVEHPNR